MKLTPLHTEHDHVEDKSPSELREVAYRRGYQQGLYQYAEVPANWRKPAEPGTVRERGEPVEGSTRARRQRPREHIERPPLPNYAKG